ncbi:MAG: EAL domain-containing protein [Rhizobiaceae bacterium]
MSKVAQVSNWLKRLFFFAFLGAILFGLALFLARNNILAMDTALIIAVTVLFAAIIIRRQMEISRDINSIKTQSAALAHYEDDMRQRIEALSHQVNEPGSTSPIQSDHSEAIAILNSRINSLQVSIDNRADESDDRDYRAVDEFPHPDADASSRKKSTAKPAPLSENSLNMHLQPIVELPSRRPAYFDAFMRLNTNFSGGGESDEFVDQNEFRKLVETAGLSATIDKKIIFSAVRMVRKLHLLKKRAGVFCPISPKSLLNLHSFREISSFLEANANLRDSLIVELTSRDFNGLNQEQRERLAELTDMGIALSLSDVQDLNIDPQLLAGSGVRFVKVSSSILLHASLDANHKGIAPANLASVLSVEGIQLIATDVERDRDAIGLIDMELPLAQGLLFAPPRPVKAELLINAEPENQIKFKSSA